MNIRQQYHFRESTAGLLAWDVLKLVKLSTDFQVVQVSLSDIQELKEAYWFGLGEAPTCESIAQHSKLIFEADLSYPIILCPEGRIMDGMHRVCKAYIHGHDTVLAVKFGELPEPDYIGKQPNELPY